LGKRLTGVENFEESEKLVMEAYRDMMKDRGHKRKSYDFEGMYTNPRKWKMLTAKVTSTCLIRWKQ
jgi:hypothetical protein